MFCYHSFKFLNNFLNKGFYVFILSQIHNYGTSPASNTSHSVCFLPVFLIVPSISICVLLLLFFNLCLLYLQSFFQWSHPFLWCKYHSLTDNFELHISRPGKLRSHTPDLYAQLSIQSSEFSMSEINLIIFHLHSALSIAFLILVDKISFQLFIYLYPLLLTSDLSGNYAGFTFKVYLQYFHLVIAGKAIMIQGIMIFYWITAIDFLIFYNLFSTQIIVNTIYCQHSNQHLHYVKWLKSFLY